MIERKNIQLETSDEVVLHYLLTHEIGERYSMSKEKKKSYSNIFNAVKRLEDLKLIEVASTKKSEKNPKIKVEQYKLTLTGLVLASVLALDWKDFSEINKVAEAHQKDLPLVFGKWKHFTKHGKEQDLIERLHDAMDMRATYLLGLEDIRNVEAERTKKFVREIRSFGPPYSFKDIEYRVTLECLMRDYLIPQALIVRELASIPKDIENEKERLRKSRDEWRDVCLSDPQIKEFCKPYAEQLREGYEASIEHLKDWSL